MNSNEAMEIKKDTKNVRHKLDVALGIDANDIEQIIEKLNLENNIKSQLTVDLYRNICILLSDVKYGKITIDDAIEYYSVKLIGANYKNHNIKLCESVMKTVKDNISLPNNKKAKYMKKA